MGVSFLCFEHTSTLLNFFFWFSLHLFSFRFSFEILFVHHSRIMVQSLAWFFLSLHGGTCTFILETCFALFNKMSYYVINNVDIYSAWIYTIPPFLLLTFSLSLSFGCYAQPSRKFIRTGNSSRNLCFAQRLKSGFTPVLRAQSGIFFVHTSRSKTHYTHSIILFSRAVCTTKTYL